MPAENLLPELHLHAEIRSALTASSAQNSHHFAPIWVQAGPAVVPARIEAFNEENRRDLDLVADGLRSRPSLGG
jgi:hypothetical protein